MFHLTTHSTHFIYGYMGGTDNNLRVTRKYRLSVPSEINVVSHEL